jgi:hypothetical protein
MIAGFIYKDDFVYPRLLPGKLLEQKLKEKGIDLRGSDKELIPGKGFYYAIAVAVNKAMLVSAYWFDTSAGNSSS